MSVDYVTSPGFGDGLGSARARGPAAGRPGGAHHDPRGFRIPTGNVYRHAGVAPPRCIDSGYRGGNWLAPRGGRRRSSHAATER